VPSRARASLSRGRGHGRSLGIGDQLSVDDVGQSPLQAPHRLQRLLAGGSLAAVVGAALGVEADLGRRGDVEHVVHPPVPGPGEPVAILLTGGGVQGCGAGPGREPVPVGEPGDVADVGEDPGRHDRSDAVDVH